MTLTDLERALSWARLRAGTRGLRMRARFMRQTQRALVAKIGAGNALVLIHAPSHNAPANKLCQKLGLEAVFSTTRMYKGMAAPRPHAHEFGIATMEFG